MKKKHIFNTFLSGGGGYQTISLVGKAVDALNNGTNIALDLSAMGVVQNDVVICFGGYVIRTASFGPITSGYTEIASSIDASLKFGAWYKVMGSTPDTILDCWGSAGAAQASGSGCFVLRGVSTSSVLDQTAVVATGTGTAPNCDAIVTQTPGAWVIACAAMVSNTTPPSGLTGYSNFQTDGASDTNSYSLAGATLLKTTPASENPPAFSGWNLNAWAAITIAIKPASL